MSLGVKLCEDGFKTEFAARLAGEKALRELLAAIAEERKYRVQANTSNIKITRD